MGAASLVGAPRILQAVGQDSIYPGVDFFEKGYNANNDPFRGYILVSVVAMGFDMLADLNTVGIFASNFFLASYCLMNMSCFFVDYTKAPSGAHLLNITISGFPWLLPSFALV